jgi:NitT/TauT family transport system substrate-binding protein
MSIVKKFLAPAALAGAMALQGAPAQAVDLTVTHWGVLMYGAPFAVAREKGYFAEAGIDVEGFITSDGGGTTLRNALASEIPYGEVSLNAVVAAAQQGVELTIVHGGAQSIGDALWITRQDAEDINGIEDLEGRVVGFTSPRSVTEALLVLSMNAAGVENYDGRALGGIGAGLTALDQGAVDAAAILEPVWSRFQDRYKVVFKPDDLIPAITQTVGVVRSDYLEANGDQIRGIVEARRRGVDFIYENPEEAAAILAEAYDLDPAVTGPAVASVVEMDYWSRGDMNLEEMTNMVTAMQLVGAIPEGEFDWTPLVDEAYLPEDLRSE